MKTVSRARTAAVAAAIGASALVGVAVPAANAATAPRCRSTQLLPSVVDRTAGAGNYSFTLQLTNARGTCTVRGFGGLGLAGPGRATLRSTQVRTGPAGTVVLHHGQVAAIAVRYTNGAGQPSPVKATYLTVIPPDERTKIYVPFAATVYRGRLTGTAYVKSPGHVLRTRVAGVAVRSAPRTSSALVRRLGAAGTVVSVACARAGTPTAGVTDWYRVVLPRAGWVSASVLGVGTGSELPVNPC